MENKKVIKYPNLISEMAKKGIKQKDVAKVLNTTNATISRKLSGKSCWRIGEVEQICEMLNKGYYELFK